MGARSWTDQQNSSQLYTYLFTPTSTMYSPATFHERQRLETGVHRDHLVRLHSVQTDLALNLPHSIALPDGEEGPHCDSKFLKLHDAEQRAEITRSFIRPPPNRIVPEGNTIPPFRSNSVGQKPSMPSLTLANATVLVTRSQSVSSCYGQNDKLAYPRELYTPNISSQIWLPTTTQLSDTDGISNRTYGCAQDVTDDTTDPPPPYSDVVNKWDVNTINRQQNSGI